LKMDASERQRVAVLPETLRKQLGEGGFAARVGLSDSPPDVLLTPV
jgi:hypothetical protein